MNQHPYGQFTGREGSGQPARSRPSRVTSSVMNMVSSRELEALCHALREGRTPSDLEAKLSRLSEASPKEYYLKQQSRLLLSLLKSRAAEDFCRIHPDDCQQFLRVLAYVRKDDDAIPDTWPGGFDDDHDVMRIVCSELEPSLRRFKAWHLAHRVPRLWNGKMETVH